MASLRKQRCRVNRADIAEALEIDGIEGEDAGDKECKESRERHPEGKRLTRIRGLGDFVAE
jgi:hypothetical protein